MPIADAELVMMALAAVLAVQHFPREGDNWEGLPTASRTWTTWKTAFCLAHLKRQRRILAAKGDEPLAGANILATIRCDRYVVAPWQTGDIRISSGKDDNPIDELILPLADKMTPRSEEGS